MSSLRSLQVVGLFSACLGGILGCAKAEGLPDLPLVEEGGPTLETGGAPAATANGGSASSSPESGGAGGAVNPAPGGSGGTGGVTNPPASTTGGAGTTSGTGGVNNPFPNPNQSGGAPSSGGAPPAGGTTSMGGTLSTGGVPSTGGAPPTGGTPSTGGAPPVGSSRWCPGDPIGAVSTQPATTRRIKDLTGTQTSSGAFGVGGTDLGIPVRQPNGQIAYIFGDTFGGDVVGSSDWRSPVLLRSSSGNLASGIVFTSASGGTHAKQILSYDHASPDYTTWLPSDVITIGNRMYLHYMVNQGLQNVRWSQIAYSDDNGENWTVSGARWEGAENGGLRQLWTWEEGCDGYVYVLSTSFKRADPILLHRVPSGSLLDRNQYEPWGYANGRWAWGQPPTPVLEGAFGEISLRRVEHKWVLSWFNAGAYEITIKVFDGPTSNLYEAATYHPIRGGSWPVQTDTSVPQLYGGYIHPDSTLHDLHLIVSQWNTQVNTPYRAMQFVTGVNR
jgi:hypothetical protein